MPIADVKDFCKTNNVAITAISTTPTYSETKGRVTKGTPYANPGWNKKNYVENTMMYDKDKRPASAWLMSLKMCRFYVIDIDVVGDCKAKDVMKPEIYENLYNESNYVVETGSGGLHFYFKLPDDFTGDQKNKTQIKNTDYLISGDANGGVDLIMDSVVTEGSKYTYNKTTYKYVSVKPGGSLNDVDTWSGWAEFYEKLIKTPEPKLVSVVNPVHNGESNKDAVCNITVDEISDHVDNIPNTERNWDKWYAMGQTLYNILGPAGFDIFNRWSQRNVMYCYDTTVKLYNGLKNNRDRRLFIGTILFMSKNADNDTYCAIRRKYAPLCYESIKSVFEQDHFFIEEPKPMYVRVSENRLIYYKPNEMFELLKGNTYTHVKDDKEVKTEFWKTWSVDPTKRRYRRVGFYPNTNECPANEYNGFFPCRASQLPQPVTPANIEPILRHFSILCNHEKHVTEFVILGFAQMVQCPGNIPGILTLFHGVEGAGKDTLIEWFGSKILGEHQYAFIGSTDNLFKSFNAELYGKILIHCDELSKIESKQMEDLKRLITSGRVRVERKGIDAELLRWFARLYCTTNNIDTLQMSATDRRIEATTASSEMCKNIAYFEELHKILANDEVVRTFYDYLMSLDISDYNHTNRPMTSLMKEMKRNSMDKLLLWIYTDSECFDEAHRLSASEWLVIYNDWAEKNKEKRSNLTAFGRVLKTYADKDIGIKSGKRCHVWYTIDRKMIVQYLIKEGLIDPETDEAEDGEA
jgi:hypothetical protein